jgi:uncharacterized protein (TIGR01777 family)
MSQKRIILAGGSGFIGRALAKELLARHYEVIVLTRSPRGRLDGICEVEWSGARVAEWMKFLDGAEAIVNLIGRNVNCPHTPENVRELMASRVNSVQVIAAAFACVKNPPRVWIQAGATGIYGDQNEKVCHESSPAGNGVLAEICRQWEAAFNSAGTPGTRRALLRIGLVLGRDGGALPVLSRLTKRFLGGAIGSGRQFISWIHLEDLTRMIISAIENENLSGTFNATAPDPVTNAEFMRELRRALHRPWSPPVPVWAVKLGSRLMKSEPSLALAGCRVVPGRFLKAGFQYQFQDLSGALKNLYE